MQPNTIFLDNKFERYWKDAKGHEDEGSFQLDYKTLDAAIKGLIKHFGMSIYQG